MSSPTVWRQSFRRTLEGAIAAERWLCAAAEEARLPEPVPFAMQVCLEELFTNIVRHGSADSAAGCGVSIAIEAGPSLIRMAIEDDGPEFDVTRGEVCPIAQPLQEVKPGGLGLLLIRTFSSRVSYRRSEGRNRVTIEFSRSVAQNGGNSMPAIGRDDAVRALKDLLKGEQAIEYRPGDILVRQGEASEEAFLLESGAVQIFAETDYGSVPLARLAAPRLLGEIGVLANLPRTASVKVLEPAAVLPVSKAKLLEFGKAAPSILLGVIAQLGQQINGVNKAISLYTNALSALEKREFDSRILADLKNPTPELEAFAATFRRFADQIVDKRRQHDEMASAALIQQSLLPDLSILAPVSAVLDLHAQMRPARHVGGDFYDFFMLDEDRVAIAIGDVCGKGIPASLFMAIVVTVLRTAAREESDAASAVARANAVLCRENASSMFATLFYGIFHPSTGLLGYCNCGHNPPLVASRDGQVRSLEAGGLPLALFPSQSPKGFSTVLGAEEKLLLFTDGVTEAMNASQAEFGEERLRELVAKARELNAKGLVAGVFSAVEEYARGTEQSDDITCLAIRRIPDACA
jgi:phosphoserine phosphatase RsbU/P